MANNDNKNSYVKPKNNIQPHNKNGYVNRIKYVRLWNVC